jgi:hypothetical protein
MKKIKLVSLFIAAAFSFTTAQAQTAEEIVTKHLEAMGGIEKLRTINTIVMEGSMNLMGNDVPMKVYVKHNFAMRQEIEFMGLKNYFLFRADSAWTFVPAQGQQNPEPLPDEAVKKTVNALDAQGELVDYKAKGHTIESLGKEDVEGTECYKIKVTYKNAEQATLFIDAKTFLLVQKYEKTTVNGQEAEATTKYSNYTKHSSGMMFAMTMEGGALPGAITFTKIDVNPVIDPAVFIPSK